MSYYYIREQHQNDKNLLSLQVKYLNNYIYNGLDDDFDYNDDPNTQCRIALPKSILEETVMCFRIIMGHSGGNWFREYLQQLYHHHKLCHIIDKYKCEHCKRHKLSRKGYGLLPEREIKIVPWE